LRTYSDLADPRLKGKVCSRSGSHPYNLSLLASIIAHQGETKAEDWARGVAANFARPPKGGDTIRSGRWLPASVRWRSPIPITWRA
jgi:iron(III) transport system substrate-binding protein